MATRKKPATPAPNEAAPQGSPTDLVRVRALTGGDFTTTRTVADRHGLQVLNKPAVDRRGFPLPPKANPLTPPETTGDQPDGAADQASTETA